MSAVHRRSVVYSQNFLRDARLVDRLLARSSIGRDDLVVEIVEADFLDLPLPAGEYKVFANIPFNVTTAIVAKLTSGSSPPGDAYLVVQQEAAERFVGAPRESLYAVLLKPWFEPSIGHRFSATDFSPPPGVETSLLRLHRRDPALVAAADAARYRDFVVFAFTAWQPDLRRVLAQVLPKPALARIERAAAVDLGQKPTATPFEAWLRLFAAFRMVGDRRTWQRLEGAEARLRHQQSGLQKVHRTRSSSGAKRSPVGIT